ncbi:MAG: transglutaminase domain-containing protein [Verrucomicrobiales bacterium]|nr:transglutaminase domain-containing protein [Verrucomicrobiales bacterium]
MICLVLIGVSLRFPHLYRDLHHAVENGRLELTDENRNRFQATVLSEINLLRNPISLPPMLSDIELQNALGEFVQSSTSPGSIELNDLFGFLQDRFPGAQFLSANICYSLTDPGLVESIKQWDDVTNTDYESISTVLFQSGHRIGCVAVLAKRLPQFDITAANRDGGRFFNRCPHCKKTHAVELNRKSRTLILACPDCTQPYDVLAADTTGRFCRANDFLLGFQIPRIIGAETIQPEAPDERLILEIWRAVAEHCEYENDATRTKNREAWKTPDETWLERSGDCEDTSILLADALISAGLEARVAVGWNENIGQHAWCVVRTGSRQYLLESTISDAKDVKLVTTEAAAKDYRPEQQFDRDHLYFRRGKPSESPLDYFAEKNWKAVKIGDDSTAKR